MNRQGVFAVFLAATLGTLPLSGAHAGTSGEPLSLLPATLPPDRIVAILRGYL